MALRSASFPGYGISWLTMTPMFAVGSVPSPAPGSGFPLELYPAEIIGSGRLRSCAGRCRAASYRCSAAAISGCDRSASATTSASTRRSGDCAATGAAISSVTKTYGPTRIRTSISRIPGANDAHGSAEHLWKRVEECELDQEGAEERDQIRRGGTRGGGQCARVTEERGQGERCARHHRRGVANRLGDLRLSSCGCRLIRAIALLDAAAALQLSRLAAVMVMRRARLGRLAREQWGSPRHEHRRHDGDRR